MKKLLAALLMGTMVFSLAACGSAPATNDGAAAPQASAEAEAPAADATYTVGVCQFVQHAALDSATEGFQDALKEELGDEVAFDVQNAQNETANCATIVNSFVSKSYDLIMANATPALQAAAAGTNEIPVLGTSVTEYGVALQIDDFSGTVGTNVSGTSDLPPLDGQANMVKELFPDAQTVALLYCSAEPNSQYQVDQVEKFLTDLGYTCSLYSFSDSNDLASVTTTAAQSADVIYVPTDNTVAANTGIIDNICRPAGVPVVCGDEGTCSGCGVAVLAISYYDLGYQTGLMAAKILTGEANVSEMPVEYAPNVVKEYNATICEELGITIPDDYVAIATE